MPERKYIMYSFVPSDCVVYGVVEASDYSQRNKVHYQEVPNLNNWLNQIIQSKHHIQIKDFSQFQ